MLETGGDFTHGHHLSQSQVPGVTSVTPDRRKPGHTGLKMTHSVPRATAVLETKFFTEQKLAFQVKFIYFVFYCLGSLVVAQDLTEDEETVEDSVIEDEDEEAEVEEDEPTDLAEDKEEEDVSGEPEASPSADTTILFVKGEDFPANNIVKFLVGFTNKGTEDFIVESLDASFRYPQDYQFYIQNFTALPLNTLVPPQRQATFEYSFIPAEPMGGRPFGLVINLNYKDLNGNVFQDAVFNQTVTVIEREDGLDGETIFMYMFLAGLGLLLIVGLHQLLESRKRKRPIQKVEMGTASQNDVDLSWIPQETLNQIMQSRRDKASPRRLPRKRAQKRSAGSDE
ncbi:translocon-associated protein subunit alpha [Fukomys damarensis]|uniref:translocon-associated protein subunit alpha n=1 Tax=Fukomys damarensis TaxID=885580 RepID=UPI00145562FB|nr:translocon-associated protein subunit alpha [Fukomys damarensis]